MADIKKVLIDEIRRLARKEIKLSVSSLSSKIIEMKKLLSAHTKLLKELKVSSLDVSARASNKVQALQDTLEEKGIRMNGKGIRKLREKLGFSQKDFATLIGASHLSVCHWEMEKSQPRAAFKKSIAQLRGIGKKELAKLCAEKGVSFGLKKRGKRPSIKKVEN